MFLFKKYYLGVLVRVGSQAGTRVAKKVEKGKKDHPILEGILVHVADFLEFDFSCFFQCPIFHHFVAIWCPKVPK